MEKHLSARNHLQYKIFINPIVISQTCLQNCILFMILFVQLHFPRKWFLNCHLILKGIKDHFPPQYKNMFFQTQESNTIYLDHNQANSVSKCNKIDHRKIFQDHKFNNCFSNQKNKNQKQYSCSQLTNVHTAGLKHSSHVVSHYLRIYV